MKMQTHLFLICREFGVVEFKVSIRFTKNSTNMALQVYNTWVLSIFSWCFVVYGKLWYHKINNP